jgi:UDP-3-O-acyl-N-acetylglucosamine deacetylase
LLDLIGDICLMGCCLKAHCIGIRSGHSLNIKGIKEIARINDIR